MDEVYDIGQAVYVTDKKYRDNMAKDCGEEFNFFGRVTGNSTPGKYLVEFFGKETKTFRLFSVPAEILAKPSADTNEFANIVPERLDYKKAKKTNDMILPVEPEEMPNVD